MANPTPVVETPNVGPAPVNSTPTMSSTPENNVSPNVVTTDGAQPFDISSMFANNNNN